MNYQALELIGIGLLCACLAFDAGRFGYIKAREEEIEIPDDQPNYLEIPDSCSKVGGPDAEPRVIPAIAVVRCPHCEALIDELRERGRCPGCDCEYVMRAEGGPGYAPRLKNLKPE
ncbi:hypothetical protein BVY04_03905 [bacterium M21]|nr:hypothetical protein BVY04_03905 [bacterium M21]